MRVCVRGGFCCYLVVFLYLDFVVCWHAYRLRLGIHLESQSDGCKHSSATTSTPIAVAAHTDSESRLSHLGGPDVSAAVTHVDAAVDYSDPCAIDHETSLDDLWRV